LTLDEAVTRALNTNPRLRESRALADAARLLPGAARIVPNPTLEVEAVPATFGDNYEFNIGVDQPLPIRGRNGAARRVAVALAAEARWKAEDEARSVAAGARERYRRAVLSGERVVALTGIRDQQNRFFTISAARQSRGELSEVTLRQLEAALFLRSSDVTAAADDRATAVLDLAQWIGLEDTTGLRLESVPVVDLPGFGELRAHLNDRADLKALEASRDASAARVDLVRAERFEDPSVGVFLRRTREEGGHHVPTSTFLGGRITLPLAFRDRRGGAMELARAETEAARIAHESARRVAESDLIVAIRNASVSCQRVEQFENSTSAAAGRAMDLAEKAYAQGLLNAPDLNDVLNTSLETENRRLEAIERYHEALGVIERMVGRTLAPSKP
jgi:outer membrane protein TolC